tara:strand:+ start:169 stop:417 length:249 start_codon:yes stop_codon:yes gene_type:complete
MIGYGGIIGTHPTQCHLLAITGVLTNIIVGTTTVGTIMVGMGITVIIGVGDNIEIITLGVIEIDLILLILMVEEVIKIPKVE